MQNRPEVSATGTVIGELGAATILTKASNVSSADCANSTYKGPYVSDANRRAGIKPGERRQNQAATLARRPGPSSFGHLNLPLCAGNTGVCSDQLGSSTYSYESGKFRSTAEYDTGNAIHFDYDAAGNIRQFRIWDADGTATTETYVVGENNELQEIVRSHGPDFVFEHDEVGRATKVKSADREFSIQYDEQSRVTKTSLDGRSAVDVDYTVTQLDIAHYTDSNTFRTRHRQSPGSGVFGTIAEIVYARPLYSPYQAVAFDSEMNRFVLQRPADWHPEKVLFDSFTRRNLPISEEGLTKSIADLDKPSSALFVPPELFSVNCSVCTVLIYGHVLTINGSSSAIVDPGEWVVAASTAIGTGCESHAPGPPPSVSHIISFDTGLVINTAIPGSFTFAPAGPFYESPGAYDATALMECLCGIFGISLAEALVEVPSPATCPAAPTPPTTTSGSLVDRMNQLLARIQAGAVTFNAIALTIGAGDLAVGTASNTVTWGLNDIERYNLIGLHVTNPTGSILPWQTMRVAWCRYGAPGAVAATVLRNFMNDGV